MNEATLQFGREAHLVGTLTLPNAEDRPIACLLPNAGVIHRIGPHRFNVKLARHLAALGFPVLRFDLAGVGDSAMPRSSPPYPERMIAAMQDGMELAEREAGARRFIIAGICSGADNAFAVASVDPRVIGVAMIDGYAYPSAWTTWHRFRRRLGQGAFAAVRGFITRRLRLLRGRLAGSGAGVPDPGRRAHPPRAEYAERMQALVDRGVHVLLVHTGSLLRHYSYREQFHDAFGDRAFASKVEVRFCPEIDHTVTTLAAQQQLLDVIGVWATRLEPLPARTVAQRQAAA